MRKITGFHLTNTDTFNGNKENEAKPLPEATVRHLWRTAVFLNPNCWK